MNTFGTNLGDTLTTPAFAVLAQQQMTTSAAGVAFIKGWEGWNGTVDKKTGLTYGGWHTLPLFLPILNG